MVAMHCNACCMFTQMKILTQIATFGLAHSNQLNDQTRNTHARTQMLAVRPTVCCLSC